ELQLLRDVEIARVGEVGAVERSLHPNADSGEIGMRLEEVLVGGVTVAAQFVNLKLERVEASGRDVRRERALDAAERQIHQHRPGLQLVVLLSALPVFGR